MDLDFFVFLMGNAVDIPSAASCRLQYENPLLVDPYLSAFCDGSSHLEPCSWAYHCIVLNDLRSTQQVLRHHWQRCYSGHASCQKLAKRPTGKYAWSPKLRESGLHTRYWHLGQKAIERGFDLRLAIRALAARIGELLRIPLTDDPTFDSATIKIRWKASLKELRRVRNISFDHRAEHLLSTMEIYKSRSTGFAPADDCNDDNDNAAKINRIQCLLNTECMRAAPFWAIHSATSHSQSISGRGELSKLYVPIMAKTPNLQRDTVRLTDRSHNMT